MLGGTNRNHTFSESGLLSKLCILFLFFLPAAWAASSSQTAHLPAITGAVTDPSGAVIPGAKVELLTPAGKLMASAASGPSGSFRLVPPAPGLYTLTVVDAGFTPSSQSLEVGAAPVPPLKIALSVATAATNVSVSASSNVDLTSSANNDDTITMTSSDLKEMPVFDNDYVSTLGMFMETGDELTAGAGIMVDGVMSDRVTVTPSAVQEIKINQAPYSAQYFYPGRGQMEIITKPASPQFHGEFNFTFRNSALNAQHAFTTVKPPEERRIFEGSVTGPAARDQKTSFLISGERAGEDLQAVVNATVPKTTENPSGVLRQNVPAPTRDTEFSVRLAHIFGGKNNAYAEYAYQNSSNVNEGTGNQTLADAGFNSKYREDDLILHNVTIVSPDLLNQASLILERWSSRLTDSNEAPRIVVQGNFVGGSAQADRLRTEYDAGLYDKVTWTHGRQNIIFGIDIPHFARRVLDDSTNSLGTYTFSSLANYEANQPSGYSASEGQVRFPYYRQEFGGYVQDQIKLTPRFSITPGLRYDWQNSLSNDVNNLAPRASFALVLDQDTGLVLRGGGGIYFDRTGSSPIEDIARYSTARRRLVRISAQQQPLCIPISECLDPAALPPSLVERAPNLKDPYSVDYGLDLDRKVGEKATISLSAWSHRWIGAFRSIDLNAPLPPFYSARPDPNVAQLRQIESEGTSIGNGASITYRGRLNKYFTGFGRYSWQKWESNTGGISWFPQNQLDPDAEWSRSGWDERHRLGFFGVVNPGKLLNIAAGVNLHTGNPWTILTGEDNYGTSLFNARPAGVPRNSEQGPGYAGLDLRWGYNFKLKPQSKDESPTLGVSVASFNALNHVNGSFVDDVQGSSEFGQVANAYPPRRMQVAMRFMF